MITLNSKDWIVLDAVARGSTDLRMIAESIDRSLNRTSVIVSRLCEIGLLKRRREGLSFRIELADVGLSGHLKRLMLAGLPLGSYLSDSKLIVLATIAGADWGLNAPDIAWITGLSNSTVSQAIHDALRFGILRKEGRRYRLGGRIDALRDFLLEYARFSNERVASNLKKGSAVAWYLGPDFIIETNGEISGGLAQPTGTTAFSIGDLQTVGERYYYHIVGRKRKLRPEDHAIDNLLLERGNVSLLTYSLIYLKHKGKKVDWKHVERLCRIYGLGNLGSQMAKYLREGRGIMTGFPNDDEFRDKLSLYGG